MKSACRQLIFIFIILISLLIGCSTPSTVIDEEETVDEEAPAEESGPVAETPSVGSSPDIIAFVPDPAERYVGGFVQGLSEEAEQVDFEIRIVENGFDQAQQDRQVEGVLDDGVIPRLWIWWPAESSAALDSLQALADTGAPVLQINQLPNNDAAELVVGYVGPDDALRAYNAGELLVEARDAWVEAGKQLDDTVNVIAVTYPRSYGGYPLSINAFKEGIAGSGLTLTGEEDEGFGAQNGYISAARLIDDYGESGIDMIYGMDDAILQGAIKALEDNGYTVGLPEDGDAVDVIAVGTVCNGDRDLLDDGVQYATTLQAPLLEGQLAIQAASNYLRDGDIPTEQFTPNPKVRHNEWEDFTLEGFDDNTYTMDELCTWN